MAGRIASLVISEPQTSVVTTRTGTPFKVDRAKTIGVQMVATVNTPTAKLTASTGVSTANDTFTFTAHGLTTGLKGQFTTSGGLPSGLSTSTDYFIIVVDADTYSVASSLANALAGTKIDLTTQGTGNHTFTATAIAGCTAVLQKSNDYNPTQGIAGTWDSVTTPTAITVSADLWLSDIDPAYLYCRIALVITAGRISTVSTIAVKEDH